MRPSRQRRGISEIVGVLIMIAVVVTLGVLIFSVASPGLTAESKNYANALSIDGNAADEHFRVEKADFTTTLATLSVDGSATGCFGAAQTTPCASSTTTGSASLTTSDTNDIIVVLESNEDAPGGAVRIVTSITAPGLTFAERSYTSLGTPTYQDAEVWWAYSASALSAEAITITLSGTTDDAVIVAFGVHGANTASPWDADFAIPRVASGGGSTTPTVTGVSTENANDMVLGLQGNGDSEAQVGVEETAGAGMTLIQSYDDAGGTNDEVGAAEYELVSATQSSATVAFGTAVPSDYSWMMIADAIVAGPGTTTTGADLYVRNTGSVSTTLEAVYVNDLSTDTFVGEFALSSSLGTLSVGSMVHIPASTLAFSEPVGQTFSFTVTSILGNSVVYDAVDV